MPQPYPDTGSALSQGLLQGVQSGAMIGQVLNQGERNRIYDKRYTESLEYQKERDDENRADKMLEYMMLLTGKDTKEFCKLKLIDIIRFKNYIVDSITEIARIESIALAYEPTDEEIAAGIESLNIYGVYNQLLSIALGDPLKIADVRKMKYEEAFVFLCNQKAKSDFERRLMEIRSKPAQ